MKTIRPLGIVTGPPSVLCRRSTRTPARSRIDFDPMRTVHTADEVAALASPAFVPTMGALHAGHADLIRRARDLAGASPVVVSIFVNPTQFAPGEDLDRYPRTLDADVALAESSGADVVFAPALETVYPPGSTPDPPPLPTVATAPQLEDAHRPTHFAGVCQVVARLFDLVRPRWAVFGEKDYQQLKVIESMVAAERRRLPKRWPDLAIVAAPTVRDRDGLALSSRNRYLTTDQRESALGLRRALQFANAAQHPDTAERIMRETLAAHELDLDYAVVRDAETLLPVSSLSTPCRALIAARLGSVRLIDNAAMIVWR